MMDSINAQSKLTVDQFASIKNINDQLQKSVSQLLDDYVKLRDLSVNNQSAVTTDEATKIIDFKIKSLNIAEVAKSVLSSSIEKIKEDLKDQNSNLQD